MYGHMYVLHTCITHMCLWMNVYMYTCVYVYVYMMYGCIKLGMPIGRHT